MQSKKPTFSVVIPCYNEGQYLGLLLEDLIQQTHAPQEVIVADSRSTDTTVSVATNFRERLPIQLTTSSQRTAGAARNAGAKKAQSEYLVFVDADMRLPRDTLKKISQALTMRRFDYVTPLFSVSGSHPFDHLSMKTISYMLRHHRLFMKGQVPGIGGFMCVTKLMHTTIHGFTPDMSKENDIDYLQRLEQQHASYLILDDLIVETSNRRFVKDGRLLSLLNFVPTQSVVGKHVVCPLLRKIGKEKEYGIF
jgi:glycosyltransferase involved in cell wall biosynthesis